MPWERPYKTRYLMRYDIRVCKKEERDYPERFRDLKGMPERFYYCGNIKILNEMSGVAVVGSRKCGQPVLELAKATGRAAADTGIVTVNGLALGCDTEALNGALETGGKCVAVLAGGIDRVYPKSNEGLMQRVIETGGCVISEYSPESEPKKYTFVERDRLQSALARGVLVVAADKNSGTMHTVNAAIRQGRRLATYSKKLVDMTGNQHIIDMGAREISGGKDLSDFFAEILEEDSFRQMTLFDVV